MSTTPTTDPVAALKDVHRGVWASGDYASIAELVDDRPPADAIIAAGIAPGDVVLDVATGSGNVALAAARLGAKVTGLDLVPELLDVARARALAEGLDIELIAGDAEALPSEDGEYGRVTSVFGVQFAPRHQVTADELVRVTAPGGTIGLVNWTPGSMLGQVLKTVGSYMPKPPEFASPPPLWGDEDHVRGLFSEHDVDVSVRRATNPFRSPSVDEFLGFFEEHYGPILKAREKLTAAGTWDACRADLHALFTAANEATDGTFAAQSEYLVVSAHKRA